MKPLLTFGDGDLVRAGLVRTYSQGIARLFEFAGDRPSIEDLTIEDLTIGHNTVPDEANRLKERLLTAFPDLEIDITQVGAGLGVHGGPGLLLVALR